MYGLQLDKGGGIHKGAILLIRGRTKQPRRYHLVISGCPSVRTPRPDTARCYGSTYVPLIRYVADGYQVIQQVSLQHRQHTQYRCKTKVADFFQSKLGGMTMLISSFRHHLLIYQAPRFLEEEDAPPLGRAAIESRHDKVMGFPVLCGWSEIGMQYSKSIACLLVLPQHQDSYSSLLLISCLEKS